MSITSDAFATPQGGAERRLFAIGPIIKIEAWEIVAVPDIRR